MKNILTQQEFDFMISNKGKMTQTQIAKAINKSIVTVHHYHNQKNPKPPKIKNLSQIEIDFIVANDGHIRQKELAVHLGVTPACISMVIKRERMKKIQPEQPGVLVDMSGYFDLKEFAKQYTL